MICDSCGYKNQDNAKSCRGCGSVLKPKMSGEELDSMINRMSDRSDSLTASRLDKIIGLVFFALSLVILSAYIIFSTVLSISLIATILAIVGGIVARYPKVIWEINKLRVSVYANADDITPNEFWSFTRKISYWTIFVFTIMLAVISLLIDRALL